MSERRPFGSVADVVNKPACTNCDQGYRGWWCWYYRKRIREMEGPLPCTHYNKKEDWRTKGKSNDQQHSKR